MSKRHLNRRQRWRIEKIQQERLERAAKKLARNEADVAADLDEPQHGTVVAHYGQKVEIEAADGLRQRCHFRANLMHMVVGDQVLWQPAKTQGDGVVVALSERHTVLKRPDYYGRLKPVAANIDLLCITFAPEPTPSSQLIDRYLVAAELAGLEPLLLLNKADLIGAQRDKLEQLANLYRGLGYSFLTASALETQGLTDLTAALADKTSVFVGQSGVGKSSLVNALLPDAQLSTAPLSTGSGLGQHTTTTAQLFHLPSGGRLIDSPGIREFGLWHIGVDDLIQGYRELRQLTGACRFRNCSHQHEPGCAWLAAVEDGTIHPERLDNFFRIADTLDETKRERYHH
ncbi:MAG TPA: small ribosomal subunit biogenesis GTPase RsgA [Alcanivoracaceae bacterium]|nr:small ribosomal subunit biogenesis GTPase RsgA [Alcanivoracaceae bacterium]